MRVEDELERECAELLAEVDALALRIETLKGRSRRSTG